MRNSKETSVRLKAKNLPKALINLTAVSVEAKRHAKPGIQSIVMNVAHPNP